jgi:hypothetical protein
MRLVTCLMLVAAVAGMDAAKHAEMTRRVQATEFGATVLADLQERLGVGTPIEALREFIGKIRTRIEDESAEAMSLQEAAAQNCLDDLIKIDGEIKTTIEEIYLQVGIINAKTTLIAKLRKDIIAKKIQIRDTKDAIAYNKESIELGDKLRADNQIAFTNATTDAAAVKAAVNEILDLAKSDVLDDNQDESKESIYDDRTAVTLENAKTKAVADGNGTNFLSIAALAKLQKAAATVTDSTAQSFLQLAALSTQAFGGDVSDLQTLLQRLVDEVENYLEVLKVENEANADDWKDLRGTMEQEISDWEDDLVALRNELGDLQADLLAARDAKVAAINAYNSARTTLIGQYKSKATLLKRCSDSYDSYLEQEAGRQEEIKTLELIYEIIKDKLVDAASDIKQNLEQIKSGGTEFAPKCHCDHACGVFDDCCPSCDCSGVSEDLKDSSCYHNLHHRQLTMVPSKYDNEPLQYLGGEKEEPSRDAKSMYAVYKGDGGFLS